MAEPTPSPQDAPLFGGPRLPERSSASPAVWGVAALVVLMLVGALLVLGRRHGAGNAHAPLPPDPYAGSLQLSNLLMSESTSLSGGKSTFIDGQIRNGGERTVTGVTVQVFFRNNEAMPPQIETLPLSLVRTREPYVDTQPVSAAPLAPGQQREFRLIFEAIPANWNTEMPEIHAIRVSTR